MPPSGAFLVQARHEPYIHLDFLVALVPVAFAAFTTCYDLLKLIPYPTLICRLARWLSMPFRHYLTLEEVHEIDPDATHQPTITPPRWVQRVLVLLPVLQTLASFLLLFVTLPHDWLKSLVVSVAWFYAALRLSFKRPTTPPYLSLSFFILSFSNACFQLFWGFKQSRFTSAGLPLYQFLTVLTTSALICTIGSLPVRDKMPGPDVASGNEPSSCYRTNPEDSATLWQWCSFSFMGRMLSLSLDRRIEPDDVWRVSPLFKHKNLFSKYITFREQYPKASILRYLVKMNSLDMFLAISLELYPAVFGFVPVFALQQILKSLEDSDARHGPEKAYYYAFLALIANFSIAQFIQFQTYHSRRMYERTRGMIACAIHWKSLQRRDMSGKVKKAGTGDMASMEGASLGRIVNLMQGDGYTVAYRFWQVSTVFSLTIRIAICLAFLYQVLGWSALGGGSVIVIAWILNYPLAKYITYITREIWKAKDLRMAGINELFQSIRFLKYYGWESHYANVVIGQRERELALRVKENMASTIVTFKWKTVPAAMAFFSFLFYTVIAGEKLTVSKTFTSLALFGALIFPLSYLPEQIKMLLHAYVSLQRINNFIAEDEVPDWACDLKRKSAATVHEIGFKNATFVWHTEEELFRLGPLNLTFPTGKLTLVTGPIGSGKSAIFASMLGEMHCLGGEVLIDKSAHQVAYCAQNAWLENASIQDNIIFRSRRGFDEDRYHAVVKACALERDLDMYEAGDQTEIGEKGVSLSGGQRARVALARAFYSEASLILLDDPLAAVDMHTARHIVEHCFVGDLAKDRTIILITHHVSVCLRTAHKLVEMANGGVAREGTIADLQASGQLKVVLETEDDTAVAETQDEIQSEQNEADSSITTPDAINSREQDIKPNRPSWQKEPSAKGKLIEEEFRAAGRVTFDTYLIYVRAAGWSLWISILALMGLLRIIELGTSLYLAEWSEAYEQTAPSKSQFATQTAGTAFTTVSNRLPFSQFLPPPANNVTPWLMIYLGLSVFTALATFAYIGLGYYASLRGGRNLFNGMLLRLIRAPSRFFDVTPLGRILNRFTADMSIVDSQVLNTSLTAIQGIAVFVSSFLFIVVVIPKFLPFAVVASYLFYRLSPRYIRASRDLRRLESVAMSPAFAGFDELLRGIVHIRAFGMEREYQDAFFQKVDLFQGYDHAYNLASNWLRWRFECLGACLVFLVTLFTLYNGSMGGIAAVVIMQAGIFVDASRQLVRVTAQVELDFNAVERVGEYLEVPQEAMVAAETKRPPRDWPAREGKLEVKNLTVSYAPELPPVLNELSFTVNPREKIGVVGRTGSGKSTLALSLLRMIEASEGKIILDGIDISTIALEDLRSKITIVSQDVSLFTGTLKSNLDPFEGHTDVECWDVLHRCHLVKNEQDALAMDASEGNEAEKDKPAVFGLESMISPSGSLSAGERQLAAMARAILRKSRIIIMDEATSQIDIALDDKIQRTIREELTDVMVITIAHRLKTIIDYDRILVIGTGGKVLEFDTPRNLLLKEGGTFRSMCKNSSDWEELLMLVGMNGSNLITKQ